MKSQSGKMTFGAILILTILCYGGFVAFKFITARLSKTEIKNDIINRLGLVRGQAFTEDKGIELIQKVMLDRGYIDPGEELDDAMEKGDEESSDDPSYKAAVKKNDGTLRIEVELNSKRTQITFYVKYQVVLDLIIFKARQQYEIKEELLNYN